MDAALRAFVHRRAYETCEYCRLPQASSSFLTFHVEHIIAKQHGGPTERANLALACGECNLHKGPNIASLDPIDGQLVRLFHPRHDLWTEHFEWLGLLLAGKTALGRATVALLAINDPTRVAWREALHASGQPFAD